MTIRELISHLRDYPSDWQVMIEVKGRESFATGIDMESGGLSTWVKIHDYPVKP